MHSYAAMQLRNLGELDLRAALSPCKAKHALSKAHSSVAASRLQTTSPILSPRTFFSCRATTRPSRTLRTQLHLHAMPVKVKLTVQLTPLSLPSSCIHDDCCRTNYSTSDPSLDAPENASRANFASGCGALIGCERLVGLR